MSMRASACIAGLAVVLAACGHLDRPGQSSENAPADDGRSWLAGDHHVHSMYSVAWKADPANPAAAPDPVLGGDGRYEILLNAMMGQRNGLSWIVATDHGGPNHSKLNFEKAYPDLQFARQQVPDLLQFYGMEFDTPGADHSSLIVPKTASEREALLGIESRYAKREPWPADPRRDAEPAMLDALAFMKAMSSPPVVIANHPSRSAAAIGQYGQDTPAELRGWNDLAPNVAIGMEGAPGHQASALKPDGTLDPDGARGGYDEAQTMGGFDPMTARLGGFWDAMLGEGRRWWVTATSDSHRHWRDGGSDFWPGEYAKTYVYAQRSYDDVLDALRSGRIFIVTGDLISELEVTAQAGAASADIGGVLRVSRGEDVVVTIRLRDPDRLNGAGRAPVVARVDLIGGDVTATGGDPNADHNPTTRVLKRFWPTDWRRDGEMITMSIRLPAPTRSGYLRVRGTNTGELEPESDPRGEDPWDDLWFYANPIFIEVR